MVDICMLGTTGGMPMIDKFMSAALINFQGRKILIDCGEGTQVAMRKTGWGFKTLDLICITHIHGDHIIGLPGLLSTLGNCDRREKIYIIGPKGIREAVKGLNVINPYLPYEIEIIEEPKEEIGLNITKRGLSLGDEVTSNLCINTLKLEHSIECLGYNFYFKRLPKFLVEKAIENKVPKEFWNKLQRGEEIGGYLPSMVLGAERKGIKLSYITDTRPIDTIPKFINESDMLICEGTYGSKEDIEKAIKNKHMTFEESAYLAKMGNCKKLMLTHFSPALNNPEESLENAKKVFSNTELAQDGIIKSLNFMD